MEIAAHRDFVSQKHFQIFSACVVAFDPGTDSGIQGVDKGHIYMIGGGEDQPGDHFGQRGGLLGGGHADGYRRFFGDALQVFPHLGKNIQQFRGGEAADVPEGVDLQPHQQRLFPGHVALTLAELLEGFFEIGDVGVKGAAIPLGPGATGFLAQGGQQFGVLTGLGELHIVNFGIPVEVQKLHISNHPGIVGLFRHDPQHVAGDPGAAEAAQYADPLVAFLYIEIAQVFKAQNGIPDALRTQVGIAKDHPLVGKFGAGIQQGQECGGESGNTPGGLGANDSLDGDLHEADVCVDVGRTLGPDFVQNSRVRGLACGNQFFIFFQGLLIGF